MVRRALFPCGVKARKNLKRLLWRGQLEELTFESESIVEFHVKLDQTIRVDQLTLEGEDGYRGDGVGLDQTEIFGLIDGAIHPRRRESTRSVTFNSNHN